MCLPHQRLHIPLETGKSLGEEADPTENAPAPKPARFWGEYQRCRMLQPAMLQLGAETSLLEQGTAWPLVSATRQAQTAARLTDAEDGLALLAQSTPGRLIGVGVIPHDQRVLNGAVIVDEGIAAQDAVGQNGALHHSCKRFGLY